MRPYYARRLARRLLSIQQPIRCRRHHWATRPLIAPVHSRHAPNAVQARSFWELFSQRKEADEKRTIRTIEGMGTMIKLRDRVYLIARPPPQKELVDAINKFVRALKKHNLPFQDTHAALMLQTLEHVERGRASGESPSLTRSDLKAALHAMNQMPDTGYTPIHNSLACALWEAMQLRAPEEAQKDSRKGKTTTSEEDQLSSGQEQPQPNSQDGIGVPVALITILCATGEPIQARSILESLKEPSAIHKGARAASWAIVLSGFSKKNDDQGLRETVEEMHHLNVEFSTNVARTLAVHFARRDNVEEAKRWYAMVDLTKPRSVHAANTFTKDETVYQTLLEFCLRNDEMQWGRNILTPAEESRTSFNKWDAIFRASAATGKSVDEIDRMMAVMNRRADETGQDSLRPDIDTFNGLIRFALSKPDPYLAERYFGLMEKWDIEPSPESYSLQVEYRLAAGDIDGAVVAYQLLQRYDTDDGDDWHVMNSLARALTNTPHNHDKLLSRIIEDIVDRVKPVPGDTAAAICRYYLKRDDYEQVVKFLTTKAYFLSTVERVQIRDMMVDFIFATDTDVGRAWETYIIMHQVFDLETRRDVRNRIMSLLYSKRRPDLATHVFLAMEQHARDDTKPDYDTYVRALEGISECCDPDSLEIVHNLLKLDTNVEPDTRMYNCLMMAYASCEMPRRALDYWAEISTSLEGPSYNSLHIIFRTCERMPFGHEVARAVWQRLRQAGIEIDKELLTNYVSCMSRQRQFDDCYETLKEMRSLTGEEPDAQTLGSIWNGSAGVESQNVMEEFFRNNYPEVWAECEAKGTVEDAFFAVELKGINRRVDT